MNMKRRSFVGSSIYRATPPLHGPLHVLRSMRLPQGARPRATRRAQLTCAPCWRFYHSPLPELSWRRPWQALTRGAVR